MSSAVAELDGVLQSMLNLKPPGVSGSKITALTNLCTANVQSESVLIQKIYTHFKKTPATHKLGVLYVVDSVTRQWVDQARKGGQVIGSGAPDGTFAAGVQRVTELLPSLMNDIVSSAPEDQKPKIKKLVEIWERSNTFPADMLATIKANIDAPPQNARSTTPSQSPAPGFVPLGQQSANAAGPATAQNTSAILEALKNMAAKTTAAQSATAQGAPVPPNLNNFFGAQGGLPQAGTPVNQAQSASNVNPLAGILAGMSNGGQSQAPAANVSNNALAALFGQQQQQQQPLPNPTASTPTPVGQDSQATIQLVQLMAAQGIPPEQWGTALQLLQMQGSSQTGAVGMPFPPPLPANNLFGQGAGQSRDQDAFRSPADGRRRSRSPDYNRRRDNSPRGRRGSPGNDPYRDRRGDYRQRSPMGRNRRNTPSPTRSQISQQQQQGLTPALPPPGEKHIEFDHNLPKDNIKVMSRTLFVGGVTSSEQHLRSLFSRHGIVQTCIVNVDKRHAFVKMLDRKDAEAARHGMEEYKDGNTQLRTKWGVGFGPRDCSDYQTGISIIPIHRLTDADRKWMLSAEYGGTGGRPIQEHMVVEEPDIEIGAGVSSKAMSKRIATDQGGRRGPQSTRQNRGGGRERDRDDDRSGSNGNVGTGANAMAFPMGMNMGNMNFPMMGPNGMPMLPPGFQFPTNFGGQQDGGH